MSNIRILKACDTDMERMPKNCMKCEIEPTDCESYDFGLDKRPKLCPLVRGVGRNKRVSGAISCNNKEGSK